MANVTKERLKRAAPSKESKAVKKTMITAAAPKAGNSKPKVEKPRHDPYYADMMDFALEEISKRGNIINLLYGEDFVVIAKTVTLSVKQSINADGFQPYEPCVDKSMTVINIIRWGTRKDDALLVRELIDKGCIAHEVYTQRELASALDSA